MNCEGYSITVKAVRYLLKKKKKEMNDFITDCDEATDDNNDDADYTNDEEEEEEVKGKAIEGGPYVQMTPGISILLKTPGVPQAHDPSHDPQSMFGVLLMNDYCLDDDGGRRLKIE